MERFELASRVRAPRADVFAWHERPGALARLTPPWERVELLERTGEGLRPGARAVLRIGKGPLSVRWTAEHDRYEAGTMFRDRQVSGPFAHWVHTHRFTDAERDTTWMEDSVEYALPGGALGRAAAGRWIRDKLERQFAYRHRVVAEDVRRHRDAPFVGRVLITGAGGFLGAALAPFLRTGGAEVTRLVRRPARRPDELAWDDPRWSEPGALRFDAVIHLAGAGVADRRWTAARKREILESRRGMTAELAARLARLSAPPGVLLSASGLGFYGDRHAGTVDESDDRGDGFLADVCREWEDALAPAEAAGIRTVRMRFGMVLSPAGGALAKMLPVFRLGLGGRLGDGAQPVSWIALDDALYAMLHVLHDERVSGPVVFASPHAVSNREFTDSLARALRRPAPFSAPAPLLRLALSEMADALLLGGVAAHPTKLLAAGFPFAWPDLGDALDHQLGNAARGARAHAAPSGRRVVGE